MPDALLTINNIIRPEKVIAANTLTLFCDFTMTSFLRKEVMVKSQNRVNVFAAITFSGLMILLIVNSASGINIFEIKPGMSKGLYYHLNHPSEFQHLSEEWNSFSRVDVTSKIGKQEVDNNILNSTS